MHVQLRLLSGVNTFVLHNVHAIFAIATKIPSLSLSLFVRLTSMYLHSTRITHGKYGVNLFPEKKSAFGYTKNARRPSTGLDKLMDFICRRASSRLDREHADLSTFRISPALSTLDYIFLFPHPFFLAPPKPRRI